MGQFERQPLPVVRDWDGRACVVLGAGPSLTQADVDYVRGKANVVAVNDAFRLAPWADVFYACDLRFWDHTPEALAFTGYKLCLDSRAIDRFGGRVDFLGRGGETGLETDRTKLAKGRNGVYQAINFAFHKGANPIVLLGCDCRPAADGALYFHDRNHRYKPTDPSVFKVFVERFRTLAPELEKRGVRVLNATPDSAVDAFPKVDLREIFA